MLVLARRESGTPVYHDDNLGLIYRRRYATASELKEFPWSGLAALKVKGVVLRKAKGADKGEYVLPLYWYEPEEEGLPAREEVP